ncbi:MAG TPA: hypothetical protein VGO71_08910 [Baekduia sp.]|jgi:hypothetical protein|nr:hypothetical protein [Baekduia sp.]
MSTVRAVESPAAPRHDPDAPEPPAARGPAPWLLLAALYVVAAGLYSALALHSPLPVLFPDEFRYSHLARSLADGQGFDWRGEHVGQSAALYVYFITPAWALFQSTVDAYHASKVLGTLALCAQIVPVWLLARELVGPRLALIPAVLSVLGTWMLTSAETVTEVLAFPLATGALCVAVMALRRPGSRLGWVALALLVLATWARIQLAVLVPALLIAFLLDALRDPEQRRARLLAHRPYLLTMGVAFLGLAIIALAAPSVTGDYSGYFDLRPEFGQILSKTGLQLLELVALGAFAPVLLAAGAVVSPRAWRDNATGPLLAVFWPAALATAVQSGFFLAGYPPAVSGIGRYVTYAVPLALILATVLMVRPRLMTRPALILAGLLALTLLARPAVHEMGEERSTWSTVYRLQQLFGGSEGLLLALTALALVAVAAVLIRRAGDPARAALVFAAVIGAVLVVQSQASWWQMTRTGDALRSVMPADLEWVDHHASGPVALLGVTQNAPQFDDIDFFNRKLTQTFVPVAGLTGRRVEGKQCSFRFALSGQLQLQPGCGPTPHRFLINDPSARLTFRDEIASASDPNVGRIVEVAPAAMPRAQSLVVLPCPRQTPGFRPDRPDIVPTSAPITCRPALTGALWLDARATVQVRYRGGPAAQTVTVGTRTYAIPAGRDSTVSFAAPTGYSQFTAQQDWTSSAGTPKVLSVSLVRGGTTTKLA